MKMKRIYCLALVMNLAVGCVGGGDDGPRSCSRDSECFDGELCDPRKMTCRSAAEVMCYNSDECRENGECSAVGGACKIGSDWDCKQSRLCQRTGRCRQSGNSCVATDEGCAERDACAEEGLCEASSDRMSCAFTVPAFEWIRIEGSSITPFEITATEVLVAHYRACVDDGECSQPDTGSSCNWGVEGREGHPINCVDWNQARTFARWVGADVDLPTEAEWEYAARGGQDFIYAGSDNPDEVAWYDQNSGGSTHPVGTKQANGYGLYDMSGNVSEWGLGGDSARRVIRGGSWRLGADFLRVAYRGGDLSPDYRSGSLGFRLRRTR